MKELDKISEISEIILIVNKDDDYRNLPANKISFVVQEEQKGLGNAIYQCKDLIKEDYFMLLLGDMIYKSKNISCCQQLINSFNKKNRQIIGLKRIPKKEISINGMVKGKKQGYDFNISAFIEKPELKYALKNNIRYGTFGNYILSKDAFNFFGSKDFWEYMEQTAAENKLSGLLIDGKSFDIGVPENYYNTFVNFSKYEKYK